MQLIATPAHAKSRTSLRKPQPFIVADARAPALTGRALFYSHLASVHVHVHGFYFYYVATCCRVSEFCPGGRPTSRGALLDGGRHAAVVA